MVFKDIINSKILSFSAIHDYFKILTDKCCIILYNPFTLIIDKETVDYENVNAYISEKSSLFENCKIVGYNDQKGDHLIFLLSNGISIDLVTSQMPSSGPESFEISFYEDQTLIVEQIHPFK